MAGPRWREIAEELRVRIETGDLAPGEQLPNEIDLCEEFNVGRNTVREAVGWLVNRGLVDRKSGKGTFVTDRIDPFVTELTSALENVVGENVAYMSEVTQRQRQPRVTAPRVEVQMAGSFVARMLKLDDGEEVVSRHQKRYIDDKPWSMQTTFYPKSLADSDGASKLLRAEDIPEGTISYLSKLGVVQMGAQDLILSRAPNFDEYEFFKIPSIGVPILEHRRTSFDADGRRFRLTVTVYAADRNRFVINDGIVPSDAIISSDNDVS